MTSKIVYDATAVLHEHVTAGPAACGVQFFRGGPINEGTFAEMIKFGMALPPDRAINTSITIDCYVAEGRTLLEFEEYREFGKRADYPS